MVDYNDLFSDVQKQKEVITLFTEEKSQKDQVVTASKPSKPLLT